jgi:hypothetical protein
VLAAILFGLMIRVGPSSALLACLAPGGLMIVVGEPVGSGQILVWRVTALPGGRHDDLIAPPAGCARS